VVRYLKFSLFEPGGNRVAGRATQAPRSARAHKALATAMTDLIHGPAATAEAVRASEILFGGGLEGIAESTFNEIVGEVPTRDLEKSKLEGAGTPLAEIMVLPAFARRRARRERTSKAAASMSTISARPTRSGI
jgi:tyrosyl-tRNA synthetase